MNNDLIKYILSSYNVIINAKSYIKCIFSSNYDTFIILRESDRSNAINELTRIIERGRRWLTPRVIAENNQYDGIISLLNEIDIDYELDDIWINKVWY